MNEAASAMQDAARNPMAAADQAATHLQAQGFAGMIEDVVAVVRRYPMQTLLVGLGCGYLLSRVRRA